MWDGQNCCLGSRWGGISRIDETGSFFKSLLYLVQDINVGMFWGQTWRGWHMLDFMWCQLWPHHYNSCLPPIILTAGTLLPLCPTGRGKAQERGKKIIFTFSLTLQSYCQTVTAKKKKLSKLILSHGSHIIVVCRPGAEGTKCFHTGKKRCRDSSLLKTWPVDINHTKIKLREGSRAIFKEVELQQRSDGRSSKF